ncbi:aspartate aminotransferase family protein [Thermosulfidibacter takaii]|nr:aspartate aminotransferase family protein [Thermosulfidibacter takaii]
MKKAKTHLAPTYGQYPIAIVKGKGSYVWDAEGNKYLDFATGIATVSLGHCHPRIVAVLKEQAEKLWHVSNLYYIPWEIELAELLNTHTFSSGVFFCNSGAEANEAAVKFARLWGKKYKNGAYKIITTLNSFHGRTLSMIAATGQDKVKKGFEPLPEGFVHVPFGDLEAVRHTIDDETVAIMVEPIQGEGGIVVPPRGYLKQLKKVCEENNLLLILDEVQTGIGRCGALFAHQLEGVEPDIMSSAKALGNGFPIGACLVNEKVKEAIIPGTHASTFGGNPLATRVALEVVKTVIEEELPKHAQEIGTYLMTELKKIPGIHEVRGRGLLIGIVVDDSKPVIQKAIEAGLLLVPAGERVVRLLPSINVTIKECEEALEKLKKALR